MSTPIAIVGGGPGGLTLAALLTKQNIPFTMYELRPEHHDDTNVPSGMLDLHEESGLAALKECGLLDELRNHTADCSEATIVISKNGEITHADDGQADARPEVARNSLTNMLRTVLSPNCIRWNHKLRSATRLDNGKVSLDFGDNGVYQHDFVIGADGAWSKIRPLVSDEQPKYGGMNYAILRINDARNRYPELSDLAGKGSAMILGNHNGLMTHRGVNSSIILYVCIKSENEKDLIEKTSDLTPSEFQKLMLSEDTYFKTWSPQLQHLIITASKEEAEFSGDKAPPVKPFYMLPVGHSWENAAGATLIGDAAHLMMPWAGEGVNLAMADALNLSQALQRAQGDYSAENLKNHVAEFEKQMFERSQQAAEETWRNGGILFGDDAAKTFADLMASFQQE